MRLHQVRPIGQNRRSPRRRVSRPLLEHLEERLAPALMASGVEIHVNTTVAGDQKFPDVAMDDSGDFVVVWQGGTPYNGASPYDIFAQRYNSAGVAQGGQITVNADADVQVNPAVAMDDDGDFVVTWEGYDSGSTSYEVFAQRFNAAGVAQGSRISVNTTTAGDQTNSDVAMDSAGNFVVTWTTGAGAGANIAARRFNANGSDPASGVVGEFRANTTTTGAQTNPAIAADAAGNFTIVWADSSGQDGAGNGVIGQRFNSAGVVQGGEFVVNTTTAGNQDFPSIAMNESGTFVVAWRGDGTGGSDIFARRFNASAVGQGNQFPVNTTPANAQINPDASMDSHGNFLITWVSQLGQDGSGDGVFARRFNLDGSASGIEFPANTTTAGNQNEPAVAMDDNGDAVIVWQDQSKEGGGNGYGIYAQRYIYVNTAPTLDPISDLNIATNAGQQTVNLAGISAGGGDVQTLTVTATSNNTTLIPNPTVTYTSPNATGSLTFTPAAGMFGTATITVTVTDDGGTANGGVNFITRTFTVNVTAPADLAVTKSDSPDPVIAGNNLTYTVSLTNSGAGAAQTVTLTDAVPTGTTFVSAAVTTGTGWTTSAPAVGGTGNVVFSKGTVAAGESATFTLVVKVNASAASGSTLSNTATAATSTSDSNSSNDSATATTTVNTQADLAVTKSDSPDPVTAGNLLTYTVTFTNNGASDAQTVTVTDAVPTGTTFVSASVTTGTGWATSAPAVGGTGNVVFSKGTVAAGEAATFTLTVRVGAGVADGSTLSNSATAASATTDPTPGNNTGTATTTVQTSADLAVTKSDTPDPVTAGTDLTYTVTLTNNGPSNAHTVTVTDGVPTGTTFVSASVTTGTGWATSAPGVGGTGNVVFSKATVAASETATFTLVVHVGAGVANGSTLSNSATAATTTTDPTPGNNTATATSTVQASADLAVTKSDSPDPVTTGTDLTYTVTLTNNGPSDAQTVTITDAVPTGTTFVSATVTTGTGWATSAPAVGGTGDVVFSKATVAASETATFTLVVHVGAGLANGTTISNSATAAGATTDPTPGNNTGTATTTVAAGADLAVIKTDSPDPVTAGTNLTYTVAFTNNGPGNAQTVTVIDAVPADTTFVSATVTTGTGWSTSAPAVDGTGNVVFSKGTAAAGETATFTIVVHVGAGVPDGTTISNSATAASATNDSTPGNNTATATTTVQASADLAVTKTDTPDPVTAGTDLTYTVTLTNNGPSNAQTVTVTDGVPTGTTFVSATVTTGTGWATSAPAVGGTGNIVFSKGTVAQGESASFTVVVHVGASVANGATISNSATAASTTTDSTPGNDTATATTTVQARADLAVTKADSPDPVTAGTDLTYTVTFANNGPSDAQTVAVTDSLPSGTTFVSASVTTGTGWGTSAPAVGATGNVLFSKGTVALGETASFTIVVHVGPSVANGTTISNSATAASTTTDPTPGNNTGTATTAVQTRADLAVTKSDSPDPVTAGTNLTYTVTLTNSGPSDAQTVSVTDAVPTGTTFVSASVTAGTGWGTSAPAVGGTGNVVFSKGTVALGETASFTLVVHVGADLANGATVSNSATAASATVDPTPGNNTATAATAVVTRADLAVTKADSPDPVFAGNNLTYTVTLTNNGPSDAQGVVLSDVVPTGTTFVSAAAPAGWTATTPAVGGTGTMTFTRATVAAGASFTFTLVVRVGASVADGSTIANTATATTTTNDPDLNNNNASAFTTVNTSADLAVTKTDTPDPVIAGTDLTYTIVLTNNGPSDAQNVSLVDTLPFGTSFVSATAPAGWTTASPAVGGTGAVTFTRATVAAGASPSFTIVVHVAANVLAGTTINNSATATSTTSDPGSGNNTGTAATTVIASADLSATKVDTPDPVVAGTNLTYTITITNNGPSDAQSWNFSDTLPPGTSTVSVTQTSGPPAGGPLPAGASATVVLVVHVASSVPAGTVLTNSVTPTSTTPDPNSSNNTATTTTTVITSANLAVSKVASPSPVAVGSQLTYTITLANNGPSDAQAVSLTDGIPAGTMFVSATAPAGWTTTTPAAGGTGTVTFTRASVAAGASPTFSIVVLVSPISTGAPVSNTVNVSSTTSDPDSGNNSFTTNTSVLGSVDLVVTKTAAPNPVAPGANLTFTITVRNAGFAPAANVTLYEILPDKTTFVSNSGAPGWSSTNPPVGTGGIIKSTVPSLAAGATATFVVVVNVSTGARPGSVLTGRAVVTTTSQEFDATNNSTTVAVTVASPPPPIVAAAKVLAVPSAVGSAGSKPASLAPGVAAINARAQDLAIAGSSGLVADVLRQKMLSGLFGFGGD